MSVTLQQAPALILKRRIKAPAAKVFAAWTQPQLMLQWFAPSHAKTLEADCDLRIGGRYRVRMHAHEEGRDHIATGVYREIVPDAKLVFTWYWTNRPEEGETLVTVICKPDESGQGTLLTLVHEGFRTEALRDDHNDGWTGAIGKLMALAEQG